MEAGLVPIRTEKRRPAVLESFAPGTDNGVQEFQVNAFPDMPQGVAKPGTPAAQVFRDAGGSSCRADGIGYTGNAMRRTFVQVCLPHSLAPNCC
ncbi:MAG TPA: hypothetical protein DEB39_06005 [Planctomycetaceae bacterium]|nr:hypothetical protein [Planctomycetaceae bacterium]